MTLFACAVLVAGTLSLPVQAQQASTAVAGAAQANDNTHFSGTVDSLDTIYKTVAVKTKNGMQTYKIVTTTLFTNADGSAAAMFDLESGAKVRGEFTPGTLTLKSIQILVPAKQ